MNDESPRNIESSQIIHPNYEKTAQLHFNQFLTPGWKITSGAIAIAALSNVLNGAKYVFYLGRQITIWSNVTVATFGFATVVLLGGKLIEQIGNKTKHPLLRTLIEIGITVITAATTNLIMLAIGSGIPLTVIVYVGTGIGAAIYLATKIVCLTIRHYYLQNFWGHFSENSELMSLMLHKSINHLELVKQSVMLIGSTRIYVKDNRILCLHADLYVDITSHPHCIKNKEKILEFLKNKLSEVSTSNLYEKNRLEKSIAIWNLIIPN